MKKLLAILGITFGAIVLLTAVGILLLVLFVDPNEYKEEIAKAVHDATGRELAFEGDISFTFYPWLGLELGRVSLSNAQGFTREVFARVENAKVDVRLIPLLRREVEVDTILLNGLALHLERDKDGRTNWDDLAREDGPEPSPDPARDPGAQIRELSIGGISVRNSLVTWDDRSAAQSFELKEVNLTTSEVRFGELFKFTIGFDFLSTAPEIASRTEITGQALLDPDAQRYAARPLEFRSTLSGGQIPGKTMEIGLTAFMDADLNAGTVTLSDISLNTLDQLYLLGEMRIQDVTTEPVYQGSLKLVRFNPRELMRAMAIDPPLTSDSAALTALSAEAAFSGTTTAAAIDRLLVVLDETKMTGTAALPSFEPPSYRFDLNVDAIDLDRYLPPAGTGANDNGEPEKSGKTAPATKPDEDPLQPLRDIRLNGRMAVDRVKVMNLTTSDIRVALQAKDGILTIDPVHLNLYGGSAAGRARLDVSKPVPVWTASEKLSSVQIGPLVQDFMNKDLISGTASLDAEVSGSGLGAEQVKQTLDGTITFRAADGAVKGINMARIIRDARAKLTGETSQNATAVKQTDFSELTGTLVINDGLVKNDDLSLKSPLLRVTGKGTVSLPEERVDYLVTASLVGTLEGQEGVAVDELRDIPVPVRIRGTFADLSFTPDLEVIAKRLLQEKGAQEVKKRLEKELGEKLKDIPLLGGTGKDADGENGTTPRPPSLLDLFQKK
jgi:AsmA protein